MLKYGHNNLESSYKDWGGVQLYHIFLLDIGYAISIFVFQDFGKNVPPLFRPARAGGAI